MKPVILDLYTGAIPDEFFRSTKTSSPEPLSKAAFTEWLSRDWIQGLQPPEDLNYLILSLEKRAAICFEEWLVNHECGRVMFVYYRS